MQPRRSGLIAVSLVLLLMAVGASLTFGYLNNRSVARSDSAAQTPASFDFPGGRLLVTVADREVGAFEIAARFESDDGSNDATLIEPNVSMTMPGHTMGRSLIRMYRRSDGTWRGSGTFSMRGQWRIRVNFDDETFEIDHVGQ